MLPQLRTLKVPKADKLWVSTKRFGTKRRAATLAWGTTPKGVCHGQVERQVQ
ncbi:MAG: hypothetical protein K1W12_07075 [Turicimonas muris]